MNIMSERILLPVVGLNITRPWVPELGFRAVGAIMGVTTFGDDLHRAWTSDPVYRFIQRC
jgi:hypothetical protein